MSKRREALLNLFPLIRGNGGKSSKKMHRAAAMLTAGALVISMSDYLSEQDTFAAGSGENFSVSTEDEFSVGTEAEFFVDTEESFSVGAGEDFSIGTEEVFSVSTENFKASADKNFASVSLQLKTRLKPEKNGDADKEMGETPDSREENETKAAITAQEAGRETKVAVAAQEAGKETKAAVTAQEAGKETKAAVIVKEAEEKVKAATSTQEVEGKTKTVSSRQEAEGEDKPGGVGEAERAEQANGREKQSAEVFKNSTEYQVLLNLVQAEAGGCDPVGKILVANVVLNRVKSEKFPNSITGVVYEKSQFTPAMNGTINRVEVSESTKECVARALNGEDYSRGALYFMNRGASQAGNTRWFDQKLTYLFQHDQHEFFK